MTPSKYALALAAADMLRMLASSVKNDASSRIDERAWAAQGEVLAMGLDKMASREALDNLSSDQRRGAGPVGASISDPWGMGPVHCPSPPVEPVFSQTQSNPEDLF